MSKTKLEPCPHCGTRRAKARETQQQGSSHYYSAIICPCGMMTKWCLTHSGAVRVWNRRNDIAAGHPDNPTLAQSFDDCRSAGTAGVMND